MADYLDFPDNLVLHLEREKRSYKVFTTDKRGVFKVLNGLMAGDAIIDTSYIGERYLKQLFVDSCINGYELKLNLIFKKGLFGVAQELAKEREEQLKLQEHHQRKTQRKNQKKYVKRMHRDFTNI